ncbi:MAG: ammonia channel protein, partial [Gammaproteobacteria bacterium]
MKQSMGLTLSVCLLLSGSAFAAEVEMNGANTAWLLTSTVLVLFMTIPGLALFYSGLVRVKNSLSILMQCFAITCLVSILWMIFVYGLAFGNGGSIHHLIGAGKVFMDGIMLNSLTGDVPETVFFMFQMTFAIITP